MYCTQCGKFIGTDADICDECKQKQEAVTENQQTQTITQYQDTAAEQTVYIPQDTSAIKLGKAIASIIFTTIGFCFAYTSLLAIASWAYEVSVICIILSIVPMILGLIFGIQSISNFKNTSYIRSGKRIPVLILGICSVVYSGVCLLILGIVVLMMMAM